MQTVFVNPERCIGCLQCELACAVEHSASRDESVAFLERPVPRKRVHVEAGPVATLAFPNRCRHCDPAPCLQVCPSGAITRDDEFDLVLVDPKRCIGCAMCAVVCPFDVVTFHPLAGGPDPSIAVAVKCDGCVDRLREGGTPACAEICKVDALVYGEINELVAAGSLREAGAVLAASGATATPAPGGDPLAGWRAWGRATETAAGAAAGWDPGRPAGNGAGAMTKDADGEQGGTS
ncbi:MAG: 4Fe-4S dicluster domain-containing protein [Acidimicrobiales bacterium]|jgi:carbon-monoxide dehydrogenase iron sulfur subunit